MTQQVISEYTVSTDMDLAMQYDELQRCPSIHAPEKFMQTMSFVEFLFSLAVLYKSSFCSNPSILHATKRKLHATKSKLNATKRD